MGIPSGLAACRRWVITPRRVLVFSAITTGLAHSGGQVSVSQVPISLEGRGGSPVHALISGSAQLVPLCRALTVAERERFTTTFGYPPASIQIAIDALAVFVHPDNPTLGLTMQQLDSIFSSTRKRGGPVVRTWNDLGLNDWAVPITVYGRNSASGTYGFFKRVVLERGDYLTTVREQPGSSAVVKAVAGDRTGIGYSGVGYVTGGVAMVAIGERADTRCLPTYANCVQGVYPVTRPCFILYHRKPGQPLDPILREFFFYVLAKDGQDIMVKDGLFPITAELAAAQRDSLMETERPKR